MAALGWQGQPFVPPPLPRFPLGHLFRLGSRLEPFVQERHADSELLDVLVHVLALLLRGDGPQRIHIGTIDGSNVRLRRGGAVSEKPLCVSLCEVRDLLRRGCCAREAWRAIADCAKHVMQRMLGNGSGSGSEQQQRQAAAAAAAAGRARAFMLPLSSTRPFTVNFSAAAGRSGTSSSASSASRHGASSARMARTAGGARAQAAALIS